MANGLPEHKRIVLKAEGIVEEAVARLRTSTRAGKKPAKVEVWKFSEASYQPKGLARILAIVGHFNPEFLTGTAQMVYRCCAAKALKPVIARLPKGERAIVISDK